MTETIDIVEIKELFTLLPHRYPFLLIDRIIEVDGNESAIGVKNVTFNEPHFAGHFPGEPIMPGVLIIEAMAQTAGAICSRKVMQGAPKLVYFMTVDGAKFRRPVVPGDVLELRVSKKKQRGNIFKYHCEAWVGDEKAAEAEVGAMMIDQDS